MRAQPSLDHAARAQQLLDSVSRVCLIPLDVWTASKRGNLTAIRSIIDSSSAHVDGRDDQGVTPLMHCASNGHLECADYLIAKGAQFKLADHESGWTAMHRAVFARHVAVVSALLKAGDSLVERLDHEGHAPLALAAPTRLYSPLPAPAVGRDEAAWGGGALLAWGTDANWTLGLPTGKHAGGCVLKAPARVHLTLAAGADVQPKRTSSAGAPPREPPAPAAAAPAEAGSGAERGGSDEPGAESASARVVECVSSKFHALTLAADGTLYANGIGRGGRLGLGLEEAAVRPRALGARALGGRRVRCVAAAVDFSLAVTEEGELYSWGAALSGGLGYRATADALAPRRILLSGPHSGGGGGCAGVGAAVGAPRADGVELAVAVAAGDSHALLLTSRARVYGWGRTAHSALGPAFAGAGAAGGAAGGAADGALDGMQLLPRRLDLSGALAPAVQPVALSAAGASSAVVASDGAVVCWGGAGGPTARRVRLGDERVAETRHARRAGLRASQVSVGRSHALALCTDGSVHAWAPDLRARRVRFDGGVRIAQVAAGEPLSLARCAAGWVYAWRERAGKAEGAAGAAGAAGGAGAAHPQRPRMLADLGLCARVAASGEGKLNAIVLQQRPPLPLHLDLAYLRTGERAPRADGARAAARGGLAAAAESDGESASDADDDADADGDSELRAALALSAAEARLAAAQPSLPSLQQLCAATLAPHVCADNALTVARFAEHLANGPLLAFAASHLAANLPCLLRAVDWAQLPPALTDALTVACGRAARVPPAPRPPQPQRGASGSLPFESEELTLTEDERLRKLGARLRQLRKKLKHCDELRTRQRHADGEHGAALTAEQRALLRAAHEYEEEAKLIVATFPHLDADRAGGHAHARNAAARAAGAQPQPAGAAAGAEAGFPPAADADGGAALAPEPSASAPPLAPPPAAAEPPPAARRASAERARAQPAEPPRAERAPADALAAHVAAGAGESTAVAAAARAGVQPGVARAAADSRAAPPPLPPGGLSGHSSAAAAAAAAWQLRAAAPRASAQGAAAPPAASSHARALDVGVFPTLAAADGAAACARAPARARGAPKGGKAKFVPLEQLGAHAAHAGRAEPVVAWGGEHSGGGGGASGGGCASAQAADAAAAAQPPRAAPRAAASASLGLAAIMAQEQQQQQRLQQQQQAPPPPPQAHLQPPRTPTAQPPAAPATPRAGGGAAHALGSPPAAACAARTAAPTEPLPVAALCGSVPLLAYLKPKPRPSAARSAPIPIPISAAHARRHEPRAPDGAGHAAAEHGPQRPSAWGSGGARSPDADGGSGGGGSAKRLSEICAEEAALALERQLERRRFFGAGAQHGSPQYGSASHLRGSHGLLSASPDGGFGYGGLGGGSLLLGSSPPCAQSSRWGFKVDERIVSLDEIQAEAADEALARKLQADEDAADAAAAAAAALSASAGRGRAGAGGKAARAPARRHEPDARRASGTDAPPAAAARAPRAAAQPARGDGHKLASCPSPPAGADATGAGGQSGRRRLPARPAGSGVATEREAVCVGLGSS